jgi:hypothetical protein
MRTKLTKITLAAGIALALALTSCGGKGLLGGLGGPPPPPKQYIPVEIMEKDIDHTWEVTDQASFDAAERGINNAGENKKHLIRVKSNFSAKSGFRITAKKVAVEFEGDATISFSSGGNSLFSVSEEQAITVRNIKLQGSHSNSYPLVMIFDGGVFIMRGNSTVQGNTARVRGGLMAGGCGGYTIFSGGVFVQDGTFIMFDNSSVQGNNSVGGCKEGMEQGRGGGVLVSGGTFIMQDNASVTGNTASESGGGVYKNGGFIMLGNSIVSGNTAVTGGGVFGGVTIQDNAKVSGNTARVSPDIDGTVTVKPVMKDVNAKLIYKLVYNLDIGGGGKTIAVPLGAQPLEGE